MANKPSATGASKQPTAAQVRAFYDKYYAQVKAREGVQLINPNKSETRTYTVFSLDVLRAYMRNPAQYYKNIIELSNFLYTRSHPYRKLINYNASMINVNYRSLIPLSDFTKATKKNELQKNFYKACTIMESLNWQSEVYKMNVISWLNDTAYGVIYADETGIFIYPINYAYAKVDGAWSDGTLSYSINMSYWDSKQDELEFLGEPFVSMYKESNKDKTNRWVSCPQEYCYCTKINLNDMTLPIPAYLPIFAQAIRIATLEDLQEVKDEAAAYKLLSFELETVSGAHDPDQFTVDVDTAIEYFNKALDSLPDYVAAVLTPVKINPITFVDETKQDINVIEEGTKALFGASGGGQILHSTTISNGTAWNGAMLADEQYASFMLRPQIETIMNRWLSNQSVRNVKLRLMPVSDYTKATYKEQLVKEYQYGAPLKLALNVLNGYTELETISMARLENEVLDLNGLFMPPQSANTQSGADEGGRPTIDNPADLSDEGVRTRDKR